MIFCVLGSYTYNFLWNDLLILASSDKELKVNPEIWNRLSGSNLIEMLKKNNYKNQSSSILVGTNYLLALFIIPLLIPSISWYQIKYSPPQRNFFAVEKSFFLMNHWLQCHFDIITLYLLIFMILNPSNRIY